MQKNISRRDVLKNSIGITGGLFAFRAAVADMCQVTPAQTPGPFYPKKMITDESINDLSIISGHIQAAKGEVIYITGRVIDGNCNPVPGALVEIWQAAASGRYDHPSDTSGLERDPNFQNWGEFITDENGRYAFKTIVPGHYPADVDWIRPPHIHYKITKRAFRELVTQMYFTPGSFEGEKAKLVEEWNAKDAILKGVNASTVTVHFARANSDVSVGPLLAYRNHNNQTTLEKVGMITAKKGEKIGKFDVTVNRI